MMGETYFRAYVCRVVYESCCRSECFCLGVSRARDLYTYQLWHDKAVVQLSRSYLFLQNVIYLHKSGTYLVLVFLLQRPLPPNKVLHGLHQAFRLSTEPMARVLRLIAMLFCVILMPLWFSISDVFTAAQNRLARRPHSHMQEVLAIESYKYTMFQMKYHEKHRFIENLSGLATAPNDEITKGSFKRIIHQIRKKHKRN